MGNGDFGTIRPEWKLWGARLTAFPAPNAEILQNKWWKDLLGEEPEERTEQPRSSERLEAGAFRNGKLQLNVSPLVIHWRYGSDPILDAINALNEIPNLGVISEALDPFLSLMNQWLGEMNAPIQRLAFGLVVVQPVQDRISGYRWLRNYIPVPTEEDNVRDFLYQVNRRRQSSLLEALELNRLVKWSVAELNLDVSAGRGMSFNRQLYGAMVDIDVNTNADYGQPLPTRLYLDLWQELINLGIEISEQGDVP